MHVDFCLACRCYSMLSGKKKSTVITRTPYHTWLSLMVLILLVKTDIFLFSIFLFSFVWDYPIFYFGICHILRWEDGLRTKLFLNCLVCTLLKNNWLLQATLPTECSWLMPVLDLVIYYRLLKGFRIFIFQIVSRAFWSFTTKTSVSRIHT